MKFKLNKLAAILDLPIYRDELYASALVSLAEKHSMEEIVMFLTANPPSPQVVYLMMVKAQKASQVEAAKKGGNGKASKLKVPKEALIKAWSSGNFRSRDICAEEEYSSLGFASLKAARNTLVGTPDPNPWPAKKKKGE